MSNTSLIIAGTGIKFLSHLTHETMVYIRQSDHVLYLVNDPAMKQWIEENAPKCESLDALYFSHKLRSDSYKAITDYILESLQPGIRLCVLLYGHPTVFAQPALDAVQTALDRGVDVKILPGISAEDCLFADLRIDPGTVGCQSFEATDFLLYERVFDTRSHLILWQVDVVGELGNPSTFSNHHGLKLLTEYLLNFYSSLHIIKLYTASQYSGFGPHIVEIPLLDLPTITISSISTLYIPPARPSICQIDRLTTLGIEINKIV